MTTILTITNDTAGNYTIQFSAPVTLLTPEEEISILMFSPRSGWTDFNTVSQPAPDKIAGFSNGFFSDCTGLAMLRQPDGFTAALPFQLAIPLVPIP